VIRVLPRAQTPASTPALRAVAAVAGVLLAIAAWGWWTSFEERALLSMPEAERSRIYERNLDSMRVLCGTGAETDAFESRCRELALFLSWFPECRTECRALIESRLPKPTR
jgi:hypothetical protein